MQIRSLSLTLSVMTVEISVCVRVCVCASVITVEVSECHAVDVALETADEELVLPQALGHLVDRRAQELLLLSRHNGQMLSCTDSPRPEYSPEGGLFAEHRIFSRSRACKSRRPRELRRGARAFTLWLGLAPRISWGSVERTSVSTPNTLGGGGRAATAVLTRKLAS